MSDHEQYDWAWFRDYTGMTLDEWERRKCKNPDAVQPAPGIDASVKISDSEHRRGMASGSNDGVGVVKNTVTSESQISRGSERRKYGNIPTVYRGRSYSSRREAKYAQELDFRVQGGELAAWCAQVTFELAGGIRYVADFVELKRDATYDVVDVKGYKTKEYRLKAKLFKEKYGREIIER